MKDGRFCLLAVDDEPMLLEQLRKIFRDEYEVYTTHEPTRAMDIVKDEDIDVVICDQRMPGRTGIEVLSQVRNFNPYIVRILNSGYTDFDAAVSAINDCAVHHFESKPLDIGGLQTVVRRELNACQQVLKTAAYAQTWDEMNTVLRDMEIQHETPIDAPRVRPLL